MLPILFRISARLSARVMRKIDPTYNACVKIDYYHAFFWTIGNELIRQNLIADDGKSMGIAWCAYGERRRPSHEDDGLPLFMLKERKHADQEEVRFVYIPIKPITEEHLDLPPLPDLMDCCKLMEHIPE